MGAKYKLSLRRLIFYILLFIFIQSCLPPVQEDYSNLDYTIQDPIYRHIIEFQDRRLSDSLYPYLLDKKAIYRKLAAEAFGSFQDTHSIYKLIPLLKDPIEEVKQSAAFSLGQIGDPVAEKALIDAFIPKDSLGPFQITNQFILEALGKCGTDSTLELLCKIKNYTNANINLLEGQLLAYYRFGLRNKFCPKSAELFIEVINNKAFSEKAKLIAAHSIQRFKNIDLKPYYKELRNACYEEKNPEIRMCLITGFSRTGSPEIPNDLEELYSRIQDPRVQCNLIKSLQNLPAGKGSNLAFKALQNPSIQISILAAEYFLKNGTEVDAERLLKQLNESELNWQTKSIIYEVLIKRIPYHKKISREGIYYHLLQEINKSKDPYSKAAFIHALSNSPKYLSFILQLANREKEPIIITTITSTIQKMMQNSSFTLVFKGNKNYIYQSITEFLQKQCNSVNVGSLAVMAEWFRNEKGIIAKYFRPDSTLLVAQNKLKLPRDIETYNEIGKTVSHLKKLKFHPKSIDFNHLIDWKKLDLKKDTIVAEIITNKGVLEIEMYPKLAPASVINFIDLTEQKFFNNKIIHRVVPNFVIQTGCPRGDGYGSLDYTLRTEINLNLNYFEEGMVGMASAGPDTECSQFFITYSPSPHLDGKYSIFGRLIKGMDILNLINQGDKIIETKLR
ncbi:MAG: peptidylprolyl isomerase [Saprospiraceae bacterium]|nr:peptidylprolyl isomerase [Saprospiraceae bacterium]